MPTFYSDKASITAGSILPAKSDLGVITAVGTYTIPASGLAAADVIQMVKIPAGATIIDIIFSGSGGIASTSTTSVGDGTTAARFMSAKSTTAAFIHRMDVAGSGGYVYAADDTIDLTLATFTTITAGSVIKLVVTYTTNP
jgi:hypothetical protein